MKPTSKRIAALAATFSVAALLPLCGQRIAGGSTGETGNAIVVGKILDTTGSPAPNTHVQLLPSDYDPVAALSSEDTLPTPDTTDENGEYAIIISDSGVYNIEAVHSTERTRLLIHGLAIDKPQATSDQQQVSVPTDTLRIPGSIALTLPDSLDTTDAYVYIPGTTYRSPITDHRSVILDSVPAGLIPNISYSSSSSSASIVLHDSVEVKSDDTTYTSTDMPGWRYSKKITLNTSATGANIAENVCNFPVLIRFRDSAFAFTQANPDGRDIRFVRPVIPSFVRPVVLPHETERYDSANALAEIWVLLDTIFSQNDSQFITMHWGNDTAADASNPAAVFDTANGFAAVWHLNETPNGGSNSILDQTANGNHGTPMGSLGPIDSQAGIIGSAIYFHGTGYADMGNHASLQVGLSPWTISVWIQPKSINMHHRIVSKERSMSDKEYGLSIDQSNEITVDIENNSSDGLAYTDTFVVQADQWLRVSASLTPPTKAVSFVMDGKPQATAGAIPELPDNFTANLLIGKRGYEDLYADCVVDEVRISKVPRSISWHKLCYENQRPDQTLVRMNPY